MQKCKNHAILQETHLNEVGSLKQKLVGQFLKPTAVILPRVCLFFEVSFKLIELTANEDGRYVVISLLLEKKKIYFCQHICS